MSLIKIVIYSSQNGKKPFTSWIEKLDAAARAIIKARLDRISLGNFGDSKTIQGANGIKELRIKYGPGYRIYYGMKGNLIVILLIGGDKSSQRSDIIKATHYWNDFKDNS